MRRRGHRRLQRRIAGAIFNRKQSCQVPPRHQFLSRNSHQNSKSCQVRRVTVFCSVLNNRVRPLHSQERTLMVDYRKIVSGPPHHRGSVLFLIKYPPPPHPPNAPTPVLSFGGTMTLVIFITNAPSCYLAGGGPKKSLPARRIPIKNFKKSFQILFKFFSKSFQNLFKIFFDSYHRRWRARLQNTQYM